jgi:hypothetical protein
MRTKSIKTVVLLAVQSTLAATHYVDQNSANPTPPYGTWATAATNIQDAVDAAAGGDEVVVTNGIYATGGRAVGTNVLANRVAVTKPLTLRSVNGPELTVLQGFQVPGIANGDGAIRCAYLTSGATLSGFTLTSGATRTTGDYSREEGGGGVWCESETAVVSNCVLAGNSAYEGGGAHGGTLTNCTLSGNSAEAGGGAYLSSLANCTLVGNVAPDGGGAYWCSLKNCTVVGNVADGGGGASESSLINCVLAGNRAMGTDGWWVGGGGASFSTLCNCTIVGNSAFYGGGVDNCLFLTNCIIYFNTAQFGPNYDESYYGYGNDLSYCCTTPLPPYGIGNFSADPQLADAWHLSAASPCRGAGSALCATGTDIDGEPWASPPSVGCDEYHTGAVVGPLTVSITAPWTTVTFGSAAELAASTEGRATFSVWDFGDGFTVTNQPYTSHAWAAPGAYPVVFRAYNDALPAGVSATVTVNVLTPSAQVLYVAAASRNPLPPYTSWATAATNIQDAVDWAAAGATILVTSGIYSTGGRAVLGTASRIVVNKPVRLQSVSGPASTIIDGANALRCVYLGDGALLSGFTLTHGSAGGVCCATANAVVTNCVLAYNGGGGAYGGTLNNCVLIGNQVAGWQDYGVWEYDLYGGRYFGDTVLGGGALGSSLNNCTLTSNSVSFWAYIYVPNDVAQWFIYSYFIGGAYGGGAANCTLNNCTLTSNSADCYTYFYTDGFAWTADVGGGGGAYGCSLTNCIVYGNTAAFMPEYDDGCTLNYCCSTPMPANGFGDITNAPLFVDWAGGNLRLQTNSPCINAGNNSYLTNSYFTNNFDLDGRPRIVGGTVDMGAYEFQGPGMSEFIGWLQQFGLPTDGSADFTDPDGDGMNNWQEWRCGTTPTDPRSALRLVSAMPTGTNATVTWQSVAGVSYFLERSTNLASQGSFAPIVTNILGQAGTTTYADTNAVGPGPFCYRVGVGN